MKPVIVEFKSEYDKWTVLRYKAELREIEEYNRFLLDMDLPREAQELRRLSVLKKKSERRVEYKQRLMGCMTARTYVLFGRM